MVKTSPTDAQAYLVGHLRCWLFKNFDSLSSVIRMGISKSEFHNLDLLPTGLPLAITDAEKPSAEGLPSTATASFVQDSEDLDEVFESTKRMSGSSPRTLLTPRSVCPGYSSPNRISTAFYDF